MNQQIKLITTATDLNHLGFKQLERSLKHFNWDYEVLSDNYQAFGSKMVNAYNYAKQTSCTHLFIVDGYDVFMLGTMQEAVNRIADLDCVIFNAEKACWPHNELSIKYPQVNSDWKYLNGGVAFVNVKKFIQLFEEHPIKDTDNDQENLTSIYLHKRKRYRMKLDNGCKVFQSIAFQSPDDFSYGDNKLYNLKTKTYPIIIHDNGGGKNLSKVYELI